MVTPSQPSSRATPTPPLSRRLSATPTSPPALSRGATARSAVSSRVQSPLNAGHARRASLKGATPPTPPSSLQNGHDDKPSLEASLKQEIEEKEQLLVKVQDRDSTISTLTTENTKLTSALHEAEVRLNELYEEQSRSEQELANRIDISEKLRTQLRELEKDRRDLQRRYNEQISTFDAERQALYDNEQHLKSRIQSLSQARKQSLVPDPIVTDTESEAETEPEQEAPRTPTVVDEPTTLVEEPAEMSSLRLELSTLSTSYASLQSTVVQMQTQLVDLKRVNHELQEENESYMILLRERTLNGSFDPLRQVVGEGDESDGGRNKLDPVDEESDEDMATLDDELERSLGRKRTISSASSDDDDLSLERVPRGESLADLPISGPGLDLAAELGRAENMDMLDTNPGIDESPSKKRAKKSSDAEVDSLRTEVKALKDANKALSLYASRIIDRIIAEEGFERVLAVDYDKPSATENTPMEPSQLPPKPPPPSSKGEGSSVTNSSSRPRPQSVIVGRSGLNSQGSTTFGPSPSPTTSLSSSTSVSGSGGTMAHKHSEKKAQRRSLSFDWRSFSIWGGDKKPEPSPTLRPLTLKPGTNSVTNNGPGSARKLDTEEDEEDRKERERMYATMKLMGIQSPTPPPPILQRSHSNSSPPMPSPDTPPTVTSNRRFSFFGRSNSSLGSPDPNAISSPPPSSLTQDALVQAEAENAVAAMEAREKTLSAELAKGSSGSFTEIQPRPGRRRGSRKSGDSRSGSNRSGSTVFSAGIEEE